MQINVDGKPVRLPFTIGSLETNDFVIEKVKPRHAVVLESGQQVYLLTSGQEDTAGGMTILGGFLRISRKGTNVRLAGHLLRIELPEKGWVLSTGNGEICPICRLEIFGPCIECRRCGVKLHDNIFCRPDSDDCFRCDS